MGSLNWALGLILGLSSIFTDASTQGWGAHMGDLDPFRMQAPHQGSNIGPPSQGHHVLIATDNTTVVAYINKQGGTHSHLLLRLVVCLFLWLQTQDITLRARDIPGFATVCNMHLPQFMSPVPEPRALAIDALSQDWQGRSMYMLPPFPLLNKVIQKLRTTQEGEVILIAPWWPTQPWFPHLLRLSVDHPRFFRTAKTCCHLVTTGIYISICTHGGSLAALPSSRIFEKGL